MESLLKRESMHRYFIQNPKLNLYILFFNLTGINLDSDTLDLFDMRDEKPAKKSLTFWKLIVNCVVSILITTKNLRIKNKPILNIYFKTNSSQLKTIWSRVKTIS